RDGIGGNRELIAELSAATTAGSSGAGAAALRLQVGGGARTAAEVGDLLDAGVGRVVVGSAALERAGDVAAWLERFGPERIVLAFDVRMDSAADPRVRTRGWTADTDICLWDAVDRYASTGLRHVLCTDIARDGTFLGPNFELYRAAREHFPHLLWQASGGVSGADELVFYDIAASPGRRSVDRAWIHRVTALLDIPFCVAGGIRSVADAEAILEAGADKISINSPALENPDLIDELARRFGSQCVVVGVDSQRAPGAPHQAAGVHAFMVYQYTGDARRMRASGRSTL